MQGAGDEFFASAALSVDQDAAVGGGGDSDLLAQRFDGNAFANDLVCDGLVRCAELIFILQAALLHGVADENDNLFERKGFLDEVECA